MDDTTGIVPTIVDAITGAHWSVLAGAILAVVLTVTRRILVAAPAGTARWISAAAGVLSALSVSLLAGAVWWHALIACIVAAPASAGFWDLVGSAMPWKKG
jgi:hypothetical protein